MRYLSHKILPANKSSPVDTEMGWQHFLFLFWFLFILRLHYIFILTVNFLFRINYLSLQLINTSTTPVENSTGSLPICYISFRTINFPAFFSIPLQFYMLLYDAWKTTINAISHE
jgi:hypothetical protein